MSVKSLKTVRNAFSCSEAWTLTHCALEFIEEDSRDWFIAKFKTAKSATDLLRTI
jgi:hypothetical protein